MYCEFLNGLYLSVCVLGVNAIMETICKEIEAQTYGLQFDYTRSVDTVQDVADHLLPVSRIKFS